MLLMPRYLEAMPLRARGPVVILLASVLVACQSAAPSGVSPGPAECALTAAPPLGALPANVPAWCSRLATAVDTAIRTTNAWSDGFVSGAAHAQLSGSYRVFENARRVASQANTSLYRTQHFAHNGHWMVDIAGSGAPMGVYEGSAADFFTGPNNGGGLMRPDDAFRFEDDRLVVEFEASAGMIAYGDRVWPEIVVTTAPAPSGRETNGWYAAGLFGGFPAIGCAFPSDRLSECRVYDADKITTNLNAHASGGAAMAFGGAPTTDATQKAWRLCGPSDPDAECRDHFKVVLERDAVTIFVNGVRYMEFRGLPVASQLPADLLTSPVYVYFASWAYLVQPTVARVHWGGIAINPPASIMR
jgi:hypothetical protein